ncbi:MAG: ribbon-helix-helix protein, CopG family [Candidatus Njordarchaeia archaeon]|nr:ribbon-helix-helix protein, CopG family [Candidatus Korarchaeota archaeon]
MKKRITISLPEKIVEEIDKEAKERGLTRTVLIQLILEEYLENRKKKKG